MNLDTLPRIALGRLPTPLEKMGTLSQVLHIPELYIKRDDLTGIGYGGNKIRKLEYLLADALSKGADTIITTGGVQSNFTRATTACCVKAGLKPVLVLIGDEPAEYRGNVLLETLMGAEIHYVSADSMDEGARKADELMETIAENLKAQGHTGYIMPVGGSIPVGIAGFARGFLELAQQAEELDISPQHIIVATGSGGTQAGLLVGKILKEATIRIVGIRVGKMFEPFCEMILEKARDTAQFLGMTKSISKEDVICYSDFVGEGYDIPTKEANEAIRLAARTEAVFLDPVYTGKAMAGLIGLVERGEIPRDDTIVFWHTGGDPALFAGEELLGKEFVESLKTSPQTEW
ncbi:MAG: D-cysteine desulfhydrase family protein [Theionarchaea archaeon]|nr:D-cysteine desulfhydrase family protein [Theionarchaea archaeon]MBU7039040.1 D-cysteine desulfhydrase family protein [Theionarchaea archaeon]